MSTYGQNVCGLVFNCVSNPPYNFILKGKFFKSRKITSGWGESSASRTLAWTEWKPVFGRQSQCEDSGGGGGGMSLLSSPPWERHR